jgi:hypothetical protein
MRAGKDLLGARKGLLTGEILNSPGKRLFGPVKSLLAGQILNSAWEKTIWTWKKSFPLGKSSIPRRKDLSQAAEVIPTRD